MGGKDNEDLCSRETCDWYEQRKQYSETQVVIVKELFPNMTRRSRSFTKGAGKSKYVNCSRKGQYVELSQRMVENCKVLGLDPLRRKKK